MAKVIKYQDDWRKQVYSGIQKVANAVMVTMWPKGKNVILEKSYWAPTVTNDGVTVAKEIELEDKLENIWAEFVKEAANKTNDAAGDGTTSTVVLVDSISKEWLRYISSWVNPFALWRGLHKAAERAVEELKWQAKPVDTKEQIKQVATISAQDEQVGELISEIMEEVWNDWVVTVEEGKSIWLEKDVVKGMQFDQGYLSPYFVTDTSRMEAISEKPSVIVTDKKISSIKEILPLLEQITNSGKKDIVLIAEEIEWEALATLVLNKLRGVLNVLAVKAPWFGDRKKEMLKDIATVTWAEVITEETWMNLENVGLEVVGSADKIVSTKDNTTVVGWQWDQSSIDSRVQEIRVQMENTSSDYDKEKLQERLARLVWWVAVIRVWAATETEMKNKKFKIEDAMNATRAAVQEWILAWGWTALLNISKTLDDVNLDDKDEQVWVEIIKNAIQYPAKQIVNNAWYKADLVIEKVKEGDDINYWFNSKTGEYVDLLKEWVIDPVKVVREALQNATSAASMLLTTDAVIADSPKKDDDKSSEDEMAWMWWMGWMWGMWMPWMM